jgi:Protein of unknown function (DUF4231)
VAVIAAVEHLFEPVEPFRRLRRFPRRSVTRCLLRNCLTAQVGWDSMPKIGMKSPTTEIPTRKHGGGAAEDSPAWNRVQDQITWYDTKSRFNQRWFKGLKVCQIVTAAAIPVAAGAAAPAWLVGGAGALIVVLEGLQQLQQYQQNWTTYRATCERLKHEQFLFMAGAGPYGVAPDPEALLAERVESLVSQEHAAWVSQRAEASKIGGEG